MRKIKIMKANRVFAMALAGSLVFAQTAVPAVAATKSYCRDYARKEANRRVGPSKILPGVIAGAATGAVIGAILGGKRSIARGAVIGGVGGTVVGGVHTNKKWHKVFNRSYAQCRNW